MKSNSWENLAKILVNYSTCVKPNEKVWITMMEVETFPLVRAVYAEVIKAGAFPQVEFQSAYLDRDIMLYGEYKQMEWVPEISSYGMKWADVYIGLRGNRNPFEFSDIDTNKVNLHKKAMGHVSELRNENTRWVLVRVPNESLAQQATMSLDEMMDFFFNATIRDWEPESENQRRLMKIFQDAEKVRIVGKETDLSFSTRGRIYVSGEGRNNMPDGEIYTAPVDDSAEGFIKFEFPGVYLGLPIPGIRLEFSKGEVIRATSDARQDLLDQIISMDEGARQIGEFGVGTNYGINRFCYDILYDEKIGGTIHIALGRAYAENNGINHSALHWDLIKDLRQEGEVFLDNKKIIEKGKFLL